MESKAESNIGKVAGNPGERERERERERDVRYGTEFKYEITRVSIYSVNLCWM